MTWGRGRYESTHLHLDVISCSFMAILDVCRNSIKCGGKSLKQLSTIFCVLPHFTMAPRSLLANAADEEEEDVFEEEDKGTPVGSVIALVTSDSVVAVELFLIPCIPVVSL